MTQEDRKPSTFGYVNLSVSLHSCMSFPKTVEEVEKEIRGILDRHYTPPLDTDIEVEIIESAPPCR